MMTTMQASVLAANAGMSCRPQCWRFLADHNAGLPWVHLPCACSPHIVLLSFLSCTHPTSERETSKECSPSETFTCLRLAHAHLERVNTCPVRGDMCIILILLIILSIDQCMPIQRGKAYGLLIVSFVPRQISACSVREGKIHPPCFLGILAAPVASLEQCVHAHLLARPGRAPERIS
eukprot:1160223-Pelagomonas_calceolata.AAC.11